MIYLDNAATTFPKPQAVLNSVTQAVKIYGGNPGRSGHSLSMRTSNKIYKIRDGIAQFFNATSEGVVFAFNCSHALNMAIKGVMLGGGHIICSDLEHNSVIRPIYALKSKGMIDYSIAQTDIDHEKTLTNFRRLIKPNTRAIVCTHASNVTGRIMPIKEIGALCKKRGITFIVDAAQSAGVINIDIKDMNIDILCTAGHKGLYGITGTGLMILSENVTLDTIIEGGTGSVSAELEQPSFLPDRFESGTINTVGILSLSAGINHIKRLGINNIYAKEFSFCKRIYEALKTIDSAKIYIDEFKEDKFVPIVLFNSDKYTSIQIVEKLNDRGFATRGGLHCAPLAHKTLSTQDNGAVRISPSVFNTSSEINSLIINLKRILTS